MGRRDKARQIDLVRLLLEHRRCVRCGQDKPLDEFPKRRDRAGGAGRKSSCKSCWNEYNARSKRAGQPAQVRHRKRDRASEKVQRERKSDILRRLVVEAKSRPCVDCGVSYPAYVMDLDHRPGEAKLFNLSEVRRGLWDAEQVASEIAKCDVVCANCHRERTFGVRQGRGRHAAPMAQGPAYQRPGRPVPGPRGHPIG